VACPAGAVAERLRDVGLADAGRADQEQVLAPLDEGAGGKVDDLGLGHRRVEGEVEVLERGGVLEAGAADALLELLAVAAVDFVGEQAVEKLAMREVVVDRLSGAELERLQDAGQPKLLEERNQFISGAHRVPPW